MRSGFGALALLHQVELTAPHLQTLLERWLMHYDAGRRAPADTDATDSEMLRQVYKEFAVLLRAVYSLVRVLPAQSVRGRCCVHAAVCGCVRLCVCVSVCGVALASLATPCLNNNLSTARSSAKQRSRVSSPGISPTHDALSYQSLLW